MSRGLDLSEQRKRDGARFAHAQFGGELRVIEDRDFQEVARTQGVVRCAYRGLRSRNSANQHEEQHPQCLKTVSCQLCHYTRHQLRAAPEDLDEAASYRNAQPRAPQGGAPVLFAMT